MGKIGELDAGGRQAHQNVAVDHGTPGRQTLDQASPDGAEGAPRTGKGSAAPYRSLFALPQQGGGSALPAPLRDRFEQSLGTDLGAVRVHTGADSAARAEALGARAFAQGNDIHFGAGQFNPGNADADHLIAHEVAHTVQTGGASADPKFKLEVSQPGDSAEVEADVAADAMVKGAPARVSAATPKFHRKANATPAPAAAPANVQQNEQVDQKKIATLIANVSSVSERIGDCATSTGDECQELLTALTAGGMGSVVGGMNKLADTFTAASVNFEKELTAALKQGAPSKEMIAGFIKDKLGEAIDHQTKPTLDAIKTIDAIDKHVKAAYGALKGLGLDFAVELVMPKDPEGGVKPVVNAHLKKVENYEKVISLVGEIGRVSGRSGSLSSACLKVVPRLIQNLDALLLGGANTDGTIKAPSECEAAYKKLLPAKTACDAIKTDLAALTKKVMGLKSSAAMQADTDVTSAERQLWVRYYEVNPNEPWYAPKCFGDTRPYLYTNQLDMVKMIGKTGECTASINTDGKINPLIPNVPMQSPGKVKVNNQTFRASASNGKRIPIGTECRIVDAKVGVTVYGPIDEHEWELIVDADVPVEKTGPDDSTKPSPAKPGANFSPNEKADPKKMATLIDSVTATSEKIGATSENTATTTTSMLGTLTDQSPAIGALGAFIQIGRVFDSAFEGFEAKINANDKIKADVHAIADKIVRYAITDAISYVAGPLKGIELGVDMIDEKIGKVISDLEAAAIDYSVKLLVGEPPVPTPIVATPRIEQLAQVEKLLALATDVSRLSGRSSKVSGATLKVVPKLINNLSALMHSSATADGTIKPPSEVEALANKITALGKECDSIAKTLTTTEARVNSVTLTATNQAKTIDKPSAERQLWTKYLQEYPGAEMEIDMSSAFGNQPRPGLWANQMEMVKMIGKEGTVSQTINGGPAQPIVPGGVMVQVQSPGKVQIGNRQFKASSLDGKPLQVGSKVRVIDSKSGMTVHGTEMAENDWELIVQPAMGDAF